MYKVLSIAAVLALVPPTLADEAKDVTPTAKVVQTVGLGGSRVGPVQFGVRGTEQFVIRNAEELVAHTALAAQAKDPTVQKLTTAWLADKLQVANIDWEKQMVVAARSYGVQEVSIGDLRVGPQTLTVPVTAMGVRRCSGAAVLALFPRCSGEVKFVDGQGNEYK